MKLIKSLEKVRHQISDVSDERYLEDGYWVYLAPGFCNGDLGSHIVHEDSPSKCAKAMIDVMPCDCDSCKSILKRNARWDKQAAAKRAAAK